METLVAVDGTGEESSDAKISSSTSSPTDIASPVVYKLVRVEGDGRFVPATDDEVMEVKNMFEEEKVGAPLMADTGQVIEGCLLNEECPYIEAKTEDPEGKWQCKNTKIDAEKLTARLEYIGVMLQKVKQEEKLRLSSARLDHSSNYLITDGQSPEALVNVETCSKTRDVLTFGGSSASASCSSSMPDFSIIKGDICLESLTVKELQETFRATFGRETTVKDKSWLKRRIAMGLTNSCDVSTTTFIMKDGVLVGKKTEEADSLMESSENVDQINELVYDSCKDSSISPTDRNGDLQVVPWKRLRKPQTEYEYKTEDVYGDHSAAKRVRKPTKRYIEELSEAENKECGGRPASSVKVSGHGQSSLNYIRPIGDVTTDETSLVTRQDSLGGSGVHVPYVSRVRRGRPRENFLSIMQQYHPSGGRGTVKKTLVGVHISQQEHIETGDKYWEEENRLVPKHTQHQAVAKIEQEKENYLKAFSEQKQITINNDALGGDEPEYNAVTYPSKEGYRRKHHRAWTLSEVIKLVEGVARYGPGRWSEIKKVSFASYSYRTSVDLKDKWRNLLRASFAQGGSEKMSRKHGSMPIPAPILQRVRQLAEKHAQVGPDMGAVKFGGCGGRSVVVQHEVGRSTGYL